MNSARNIDKSKQGCCGEFDTVQIFHVFSCLPFCWEQSIYSLSFIHYLVTLTAFSFLTRFGDVL